MNQKNAWAQRALGLLPDTDEAAQLAAFMRTPGAGQRTEQPQPEAKEPERREPTLLELLTAAPLR